MSAGDPERTRHTVGEPCYPELAASRKDIIVNAPTLETERLVLRPFTDGDIELLVDSVFSDPDVMKTLPGDTETPEEQAECAKHYTDAYTAAWPEHGYGG